MRTSRESVAAALFTLLQATQIAGQPAFKSSSRRPKIWSNATPAEQPAMYLAHTGEQLVQNQSYGLTKYLLHFEILIYARADATPSTVPDTLINSILDAIDAQMQSTPPGDRQTLGNVVYHAWIEGEILIDGAILDQQQVVIMIPVRVLVGI
jgi:hypothetical protein